MSFLGDIFKIATGVAVGNKVSQGRQNDGSGRQNLFGSAICNYGRQTDGRDQFGGIIQGGGIGRVVCGLDCPASSQCTQRGKFKVGS